MVISASRKVEHGNLGRTFEVMYLKMYVNKATKRFEGFGGAELRGAAREGPSRGAASSTYVHAYVHVYV